MEPAMEASTAAAQISPVTAHHCACGYPVWDTHVSEAYRAQGDVNVPEAIWLLHLKFLSSSYCSPCSSHSF